MREAAVTFAKGFCMGSADVIPGVSGGTMALILGIYQRLLEAIRAFDLRLVRLLLARDARAVARHADLGFIVPLGLGIAGAIMFFTRVVSLPRLIQTHPEPVYGFFFGLVAASVVVLLGELRRLDRWDAAWLLAGVGAGVLVTNLVPVATPESASFVFLSGAVAISAMLLPGISGAFILLILRKYAYVFDAIGRLDLGVLLPFGLGVVAGLMLFSRALVWLLHAFRQRTLVAITGLLAGSLWVLWPFQDRIYEVVRGKSRLIHATPVAPWETGGSPAVALALAALGLAVVLALRWMASRRTRSLSGSGDHA